jgi:hypothetical protein
MLACRRRTRRARSSRLSVSLRHGATARRTGSWPPVSHHVHESACQCSVVAAHSAAARRADSLPLRHTDQQGWRALRPQPEHAPTRPARARPRQSDGPTASCAVAYRFRYCTECSVHLTKTGPHSNPIVNQHKMVQGARANLRRATQAKEREPSPEHKKASTRKRLPTERGVRPLSALSRRARSLSLSLLYVCVLVPHAQAPLLSSGGLAASSWVARGSAHLFSAHLLALEELAQRHEAHVLKGGDALVSDA